MSQLTHNHSTHHGKHCSLNNTVQSGRYRPEIDGLRAFAVVVVIINHFNKAILPGGYLGVDMFFVISGYVITFSLFKRHSENFKDFLSGFYERRIKRLVPALSAFVVVMSIAICCFNPSPGSSLKSGIASLFGLSNLYLLNQSTDYFAQSTNLNVFTHTWSLGVEEQFYILFPFLIWFSGFGRQTKNGARNLFVIVCILTFASLIGFLYLYPTNQSAAYFLMPSRFWEMAAGCLIFIGFQKRASIEQFLEKVPPLLILALIVCVMYLPMSFAAASTIAVVVLTSILIACLKKQTLAFNLLANSKVVYVGLISYSLYLWHWGVLSISRWTIGIHWWSVPFQVALMFSLAVASYRYIETPLRKGNWFGKRWKTLLVGTGVLTITSISVAIIPKTGAKEFFLSIGNNIYPPAYFVKAGVPQQDLYCHLPHKINSAFQDCLVSKEAGTKNGNIFLIGDSHASNHFWSIDNALKKVRSNFTVKTLVEHGFIRHMSGENGCAAQKICIEDAETAYKLFFQDYLKPGDFIFISLARDRFSDGEFNGSIRNKKHEKLQFLHNNLLKLSRIAEKQSAHIVLIGDIPKVCPDGINYVHDILVKGNISLCTVDESISIGDRDGMNNVFLNISKLSTSVSFVDPHEKLCFRGYCSVINRQGSILYSDTSPHFSENSKRILTIFWVEASIQLGIGDNIF